MGNNDLYQQQKIINTLWHEYNWADLIRAYEVMQSAYANDESIVQDCLQQIAIVEKAMTIDGEITAILNEADVLIELGDCRTARSKYGNAQIRSGHSGLGRPFHKYAKVLSDRIEIAYWLLEASGFLEQPQSNETPTPDHYQKTSGIYHNLNKSHPKEHECAIKIPVTPQILHTAYDKYRGRCTTIWCDLAEECFQKEDWSTGFTYLRQVFDATPNHARAKILDKQATSIIELNKWLEGITSTEANGRFYLEARVALRAVVHMVIETEDGLNDVADDLRILLTLNLGNGAEWSKAQNIIAQLNKYPNNNWFTTHSIGLIEQWMMRVREVHSANKKAV